MLALLVAACKSGDERRMDAEASVIRDVRMSYGYAFVDEWRDGGTGGSTVALMRDTVGRATWKDVSSPEGSPELVRYGGGASSDAFPLFSPSLNREVEFSLTASTGPWTSGDWTCDLSVGEGKGADRNLLLLSPTCQPSAS